MILPSDVQVLVVDDDQVLANMLGELFRSAGFSVRSASNGRLALDALAILPAHVVLTDIRMPVMDGIALLKEIRQQHHEQPPVFVISGYTDQQVDLIYNAGAAGFFSKPFSVATVRDAINKSFLSAEQRWSAPFHATVNVRIGKRFQNFDSLIESGEVRFGNGGVFVTQANPNCNVGDLAQLTLSFEEAQPFDKLECTGIVRWVNRIDRADKRRGLGIEFVAVKEPGRKVLCDWLKQQRFTSFIPMN